MPTNACTAILFSAKRRNFIGQHPTKSRHVQPQIIKCAGHRQLIKLKQENTASRGGGNYAGDLAEIQYMLTLRPNVPARSGSVGRTNHANYKLQNTLHNETSHCATKTRKKKENGLNELT